MQRLGRFEDLHRLLMPKPGTLRPKAGTTAPQGWPRQRPRRKTISGGTPVAPTSRAAAPPAHPHGSPRRPAPRPSDAAPARRRLDGRWAVPGTGWSGRRPRALTSGTDGLLPDLDLRGLKDLLVHLGPGHSTPTSMWFCTVFSCVWNALGRQPVADGAIGEHAISEGRPPAPWRFAMRDAHWTSNRARWTHSRRRWRPRPETASPPPGSAAQPSRRPAAPAPPATRPQLRHASRPAGTPAAAPAAPLRSSSPAARPLGAAPDDGGFAGMPEDSPEVSLASAAGAPWPEAPSAGLRASSLEAPLKHAWRLRRHAWELLREHRWHRWRTCRDRRCCRCVRRLRHWNVGDGGGRVVTEGVVGGGRVVTEGLSVTGGTTDVTSGSFVGRPNDFVGSIASIGGGRVVHESVVGELEGSVAGGSVGITHGGRVGIPRGFVESTVGIVARPGACDPARAPYTCPLRPSWTTSGSGELSGTLLGAPPRRRRLAAHPMRPAELRRLPAPRASGPPNAPSRAVSFGRSGTASSGELGPARCGTSTAPLPASSTGTCELRASKNGPPHERHSVRTKACLARHSELRRPVCGRGLCARRLITESTPSA